MRIINKSILVILAVFFTISVQAQTEKMISFFDQYQGQEGFTTVYITPKMFELFSSIEVDDEEFTEVQSTISDLKGIRILVMDADENKVNNPLKLYEEVARYANNVSYEDLMVIKDGSTDVKFMIRESSKKVIEELILLVGDEDQFVFISLVGQIDLKKISSLSKSMDVDGLEYLEELSPNRTANKTQN